MGYTHYWDTNSKITDEQWEKSCNFVNKAIKTTSAEIVGGHAEVGTDPEVSVNRVVFNGVEDDGHETFHIPRNNGEWEFCKTARKPYDDLVIACLLAAMSIGVIGGWSSDGEKDEHQQGYDLYKKVSNAL